MTIDEVIRAVGEFECNRVEVTGGEPMFQEATQTLLETLISKGYQVMMETNGSRDLSKLPEKLVKIIDIKCPDSGAAGSFKESNYACISKSDEIKFVISTINDFEWAIERIAEKDLLSLCKINISPVDGKVDAGEVAQWILDSGLDLRLNLQIHKYLDLP